jgi:molybdopterin-guanine dinucleotide biosynthesis protein A
MMTLLEQIRTVGIPPSELLAGVPLAHCADRADRERALRWAFFNINTPADLSLARQLLDEQPVRG